MKQHATFLILLLIITTTTLLVHQTTASCGVCGTNGIACISETEFYLCFNSQPDNSTVQTCPNNGTCTSLMLKCSDAANAPADCEPLACGCTVDSGMFVCTSRTTYAQCNGNVTVATGTCPTGLTCAATRGGEICVDDCLLEGQIECDRAAPEN
ncbi:PREDICTED: uncharacterized protein LOC108371513 [Rhagoletis zephyria]|uniref:uncharacterized protein LOC108371513 n=1 Tax=Rhagoletis zephyria TaxID=28612 RepID=UPI0008119F68|nr:PREDICTED: uncharacterized protein LOC108371513 [Rhagoletis zephyria]